MNEYRRAKVAILTITHATSAECIPESSYDSALRRTVAKGLRIQNRRDLSAGTKGERCAVGNGARR